MVWDWPSEPVWARDIPARTARTIAIAANFSSLILRRVRDADVPFVQAHAHGLVELAEG